MNRIVFPLKSKMKSPTVGDLQDGLQWSVDKGFITLRGDRKKIADARALERLRSALKKNKETMSAQRSGAETGLEEILQLLEIENGAG